MGDLCAEKNRVPSLAYCSSEKGKLQATEWGAKRKAFSQTEEGKAASQAHSKTLNALYATEEGKAIACNRKNKGPNGDTPGRIVTALVKCGMKHQLEEHGLSIN